MVEIRNVINESKSIEELQQFISFQHSVLLCERSKMLPAFRTAEEVLKERMYILELIGFVAGTMGCIFLPIAIQNPDWRMWFNEKSSHYAAGVTQLGIWKICFPPNSKDFESLECCHGFDLFEEFFPLEMKVAQVLMFTGSFFAFVGLLLAFLIPWNSYFRQYVKTIFLPFMGGNFFLISSICVFVPITWNVYSILKDETISFPPSYHLPAKPISQRIGGAVYLGYMSSGLLLVSGFSVLFHVAQRTKLSNIFRSRRVLPV
ncbi:claudin-34-like [Erythrolamprus reginae]|uniref:claudin-34-like n=1 Tax=Erythrolamprus reginae TaxID=121349 RepID=UPI00396C8644